RLKPRILTLKAENVRGINDGPAGDTALEQVLNRNEVFRGVGKTVLIDGKVACGQQNLDLRQQTHRGDGDTCRLPTSGVHITNLGKQQRQMPLLQLQGALLGEVLVQSLPNAAEGLLEQLRFLFQTRRMFA